MISSQAAGKRRGTQPLTSSLLEEAEHDMLLEQSHSRRLRVLLRQVLE